MINYADRIKYLREKADKSEEDVCDELNITSMSLFDLETHKEELLSALSLNQVIKLASLFNIPSLLLFIENDNLPQIKQLEYDEIIKVIKQFCEVNKQSIENLEDEVGWSFDALLESQEKYLDSYDVSFLIDLSNKININWLKLIPKKNIVT